MDHVEVLTEVNRQFIDAVARSVLRLEEHRIAGTIHARVSPCMMHVHEGEQRHRQRAARPEHVLAVVEHQQDLARAHRLGQERVVTALRLVTRGTVEEKILKLQAHKRGLIEAALEVLAFLLANTYGGGTTVNGGILRGTTTSLQGDIVTNAAVYFYQATTGTYAGTMSGSGSMLVTGGGTVILTGNSTYSGGTTVRGGILAYTTGTSLGTGTIALSDRKSVV